MTPGGDRRASPAPAGKGRPLVFIHGWAMAPSVFIRQLDYFSTRGYRSFAPALPGHDGTPFEPPFTLEQAAGTISQLIHDEGLERPVLVGWSMGVQAILALLDKSPLAISALCFVGGTPRFTASDDFPHGLPLKDLLGMKAKLKRDPARAIREFRQSIAKGLGEAESPFILDARIPSFEAAIGGLDELECYDGRGVFEKIDTPVLIIHGRDDRVCPFGAAEYMMDHVANAELAAVEGGHIPFLSSATFFNERLEEFLERN